MSYPGGSLSDGSIQRIYDKTSEGLQPILQVIDIKKIVGKENKVRYRLIISDSRHYIYSMMTTHIHNEIENGNLEVNGIIRLTEFVCKEGPGKKGPANVVIILNFDNISKYGAVIGNPVNIENRESTETQTSMQSHTPSTSNSSSTLPVSNTHTSSSSSGSLLGDGLSLVEISKLNFYLLRWVIRARCSYVGDIKRWSNDRGSGHLMSVQFLDESGEIRATMFNDAVEKFSPIFQVGNVYMISKAQIRHANKKYSSLKHDYELTIDTDTEVQLVNDESANSIPKMHFSFVALSNIKETQKNDLVDIIGVVMNYKPAELKTFSDRETYLREIEICDDSNHSINLTMWGDKVQTYNENVLFGNPVIAIKGAKVSDFKGRTLSTTSLSQVEVNPDIDKTHALRKWYDSKDPSYFQQHVTSLSKSSSSFEARNYADKTIAQIKEESINRAGTDYVQIIGSIYHIKKEQNFAYKSCKTDGCLRKLVEGDRYFCEKCQKYFDDYNLTYAFNISIADHTGVQRVSLFDQVGTILFGYDAKQFLNIRDNDPNTFDLIHEECKYKSFVFKASVSEEVYKGESSTRCKIWNMAPVDFVEETSRLIEKINLM